jgi:hypothetical protein
MGISIWIRGNVGILLTAGVMLGLADLRTCRAQGAGGGRIRQQDTFTSSNLLNPGTHDDWPLAARDGETLIISVSSQDFDPAVELVGPNGQVVAKNDDVRQGEKDSLLLARPTMGGDYQVRVMSSDGATGGRYELMVRRFIATDLPIGSRTTGTLGRSLAHWHRFRAELGQTLVITARAASFVPLTQVFAPNGEQIGAIADGAGRQDTARAIFLADQAGMYLARIAPTQGGDPRASYAVTAALGRVFPTAIGDPNPDRRLDAGGLDLWNFRGGAT